MLIQRKEYLDKLIAFKDKQVVKIITGIRRCGKSTLLEMYRDYLLENGVRKEQIISLNFEDFAYEDLTDAKKLYEYLLTLLDGNKTTYIFLDEVQQIQNFQKVVDSLYIKKESIFILPVQMLICSRVKLLPFFQGDMSQSICCPFHSRNTPRVQEALRAFHANIPTTCRTVLFRTPSSLLGSPMKYMITWTHCSIQLLSRILFREIIYRMS